MQKRFARPASPYQLIVLPLPRLPRFRRSFGVSALLALPLLGLLYPILRNFPNYSIFSQNTNRAGLPQLLNLTPQQIHLIAHMHCYTGMHDAGATLLTLRAAGDIVTPPQSTNHTTKTTP